jgi:LysR family transcriptional regulator, regulator for bpeEF and oprC
MISLQPFLAFAETARHGSFARAARDLGLAPSTVAKSVARLEAQLGVRLFHRTTRQVSLTPDGDQLYLRCERVLAEVEDLQTAAAGVRGEPVGTLRIDAPVVYGRRVIVPVLAQLAQAHPRLSIDVRLSDQYCDPVKDGLDAVVRIGVLSDSSLVGKRVGEQHLLTCASPDYFAKHGTPRRPDALRDHMCLAFRLPSTGRDRPLHFLEEGRSVVIDPPRGFRLGDGEAMVEAACADAGIVQVPHYMAEDAIAAGRLREVLRPFRPAPTPISVVYPGSRLMAPRLRAFLDAFDAQRHPEHGKPR